MYRFPGLTQLSAIAALDVGGDVAALVADLLVVEHQAVGAEPLFGHILGALEVQVALVGVREEAVGLGALEVGRHRRTVRLLRRSCHRITSVLRAILSGSEFSQCSDLDTGGRGAKGRVSRAANGFSMQRANVIVFGSRGLGLDRSQTPRPAPVP